ncbi:MAG: glycoside hydrolase family 16 protein [Verrucomicrobia bacterium]|nr:glycoside hydrolase family 16 protein [Verrucomicrobiota bacterium]
MRTISFSGYEWDVRAKGTGGPGPNTWDDANAQVDDTGWLHLKITGNTDPEGSTEWRCVELSTQQRLGFGRYQFQVIGRIDRFDRNVVLGLFKYPTPDVGPDGTNEIDIEFARWGRATANNADYVVYPASGPRVPGDNVEFRVALNGGYTTHRFLWQSDQVTFQSLHGHRDDDADEFERWQYAPGDGRLIPQQPTPVRINLWLFRGMAPSDGAEVEMIISQFTFTPLDQLP